MSQDIEIMFSLTEDGGVQCPHGSIIPYGAEALPDNFCSHCKGDAYALLQLLLARKNPDQILENALLDLEAGRITEEEFDLIRLATKKMVD